MGDEPSDVCAALAREIDSLEAMARSTGAAITAAFGDFPWLHRNGILRAQIVGETADRVLIIIRQECRLGHEPRAHTYDKAEFLEKFTLNPARLPPSHPSTPEK